MRLAAVFIEDHSYANGGYNVNFGGNFYYEVSLGDGNCTISRTKNKSFVEGFFDDSGIVTNVSAIVGDNGSGKTSMIYEILGLLNKDFISGVEIWEDAEITYTNTYRFNLPIILKGNWSNNIKNFHKEIGTIYYSPYLDHKVSARGIDISADRYLREDLVNIDSTFDANSKVVISERLKRADYQRFINFQNSDFSEKIKASYGLLNDDTYRVIFVRHKIDANSNGVKFENTPDEFRSFLNTLFLDIQNEYDSFNRSVSSDEERFELNKKQFKNLILMDLFCLLVKLMERHNTFLEEGHFLDKNALDKFVKSQPNPEDEFRFWLNNYEYSKWNKKPLPDKEVLKILDYLNNYIDNLKFSPNGTRLDWSSKSLYFDEQELNILLDLNEGLLLALNKYYSQNGGDDRYVFQSVSDLQYFISLEFANRHLSSGETALLNMYSRLYDFFNRNILNHQTTQKNDYYILFLDEADLGYHPAWKKSFVKSILSFSVDFFKEVGAKVQIIFTTHDPLTLSDIPNTNVVYIKRDIPSKVLGIRNSSRPQFSFASNVNDLLGHSFFLQEILIGDFAKDKIEEVINWIGKNKKNTQYNKEEFEKMQKTVSLIEEPVLRNKLVEMLSEIEINEDFINEMIAKETAYLRSILRRNND